jgi:hypothetical protein
MGLACWRRAEEGEWPMRLIPLLYVYHRFIGVIMDRIAQILVGIKIVEEKFAKIQENPSLYGSENGLTNKEVEILDKLIEYIGVAGIAADSILKRYK